ncbi:hypothetical protein LTR78_006634 [Recurvomyces mirabilis]|uniref:Uncharacterized protein n=1 Tax=Recurvomyces mirabilis TaxID=574656 RepID=A0AAE1BZH6_9PEZI|nr:hypothetical protein LTR78_006634 [Recurvomyces mirabilis]KAK5151475.1 hypothetical protein LTS14_009319 [Recurvomyces mirabilis]
MSRHSPDACEATASRAYRPSRPALYPDIADTSHASPNAIEFFRKFYTLKSSDSPNIVDCYDPNQTEYYDSTLGLTAGANRSSLVATLRAIEAQWAETAPNDRSYPLRILGDTIHGAIVHAVDTPGLFGAEIRELSTFDFVNGTTSRQIDAWDARGNSVTSTLTGDPVYPDLGLPGLAERAAAEMGVVVDLLNTALSTGNATAAASLFSYDAVLEDMTLRLRVEGRSAITSYLNRTVQSLPYGEGTAVTHVLGSAMGGGYE